MKKLSIITSAMLATLLLAIPSQSHAFFFGFGSGFGFHFGGGGWGYPGYYGWHRPWHRGWGYPGYGYAYHRPYPYYSYPYYAHHWAYPVYRYPVIPALPTATAPQVAEK